jgi:hypothetical protein
MKATGILIGFLAAMALVSILGGNPAGRHAPDVLDPAWMILSGTALIALGSAVRKHIP